MSARHLTWVIFSDKRLCLGYNNQICLERTDVRLFETYKVYHAIPSRFWHILNWMSNFSRKKANFFRKFPIFPHFWYTFSIESQKIRVFSSSMKINQRKKVKIANFGHFMVTKTSISQICLKYVQIIDFAGFLVLPNVKKWVGMSWNLVIFAVLCQQTSKFQQKT